MPQGVVFGLASSVLFGASTPLAKMFLGWGINPWLLAALFYLGSGTGLAIIYGVRWGLGRVSTEAPLRARDVPRLALVILAGGVAGPVCLMIGLTHTAASSASLLLNLEGIATMALAWLAFRESTDRRIVLGAVLILGGALILSWHGEGVTLNWGALWIAVACLAWGIDNNLTRKLSSADPLQIAMVKGLVAGLVNLGLASWIGAHLPSVGTTLGAVAVGFLGYGLSLVLFVLALRHLGSARTGAYFSTAPFVGAILSVLFLDDSLTLKLGVAAVMMAAGIWLHLTERHDHVHTHEEMEHEHRHIHDAHHQHLHSSDDPPGEPHTHRHRHTRLTHSHPHFPDLHHRHGHET